MTRRQLAGAAAGMVAAGTLQAASASSARVQTEVKRITLRHTWTTVMSSSDYRDVLYLSYTKDGITGRGEGAPIVRYHESAAGGIDALKSHLPDIEKNDPFHFAKITSTLAAQMQGQYAARSALEIALLDWVCQKWGIPLYRYFGLDPKDAPVTTYSIGVDTPEMTRTKVREAELYPVLKVKVGLGQDEATLQAIRSLTKKPLRVDANEGYKTKEEAVRQIKFFEGQGVEFIEQPMAGDRIEDARWIRGKVHLPIFADEACLRPEDVPRIADAFDGVVIKLDKCGGPLQAYRMIQVARAHKLKIMLGCMVSSSVAITAAAHLSPLVDYADLDGNLLISNDPYSGVKVVQGRLTLPDRPGLGLVKA